LNKSLNLLTFVSFKTDKNTILMISINNVTVDFTGEDLFKDISFVINPRDRIGLVGKNGAGKSTLLKIIIGEFVPAKGSVTIPGDIKFGYLPQQMIYPEGKTVFDETMNAFHEILDIEKDIKKTELEITERTDYESDEYLHLLNKHSELIHRFELIGGANLSADVETTLKGLGFKQSDFNRITNEFSGGWRMRIELAKILLRKPNVFLLDEPTNHLDIESIQWLEDFLKEYPGAVVLISHDRTFLDTVTKRTVEISAGKLYDYDASYTKYVELRKERRTAQLAAYENQQKYIEDTEKFIERFRYKATKSVQVQSRIKQLEKVEQIEIDIEDNSAIHFKFPPSPRAGDIIIEAQNLSKSYSQNLVLHELDFILERNEKVAFVGRNGEGKTTFARVILGELDYVGKLKFGHNVSIGYYAQNQDDLLDLNKTVWQTLDDIAVGDIRTKLRDILGSFLFRNDDIDKKVKVLSGGERARLALAKLLLQPYSLLVLDEPTNHLDMRSKEILKDALNQYDGTLIIVSHDRDFLDNLVDTVYEFKDKKTRQHKGGIFDFLRRKKIDDIKEIERKQLITKSEKNDEKISDNKQKYFERKEQEKILRKIKKQIEESEIKIADLENEIKKADNLLTNPENISNHDIFEKYEILKKNLEAEMQNWELLHSNLEEVEKEFGRE